MERKQVYKLIDEEREYQASKGERSIESDADHSVADWVIYLEYQIQQAKRQVYMLDKNAALAHVRKVAALAVACMENNDAPGREAG